MSTTEKHTDTWPSPNDGWRKHPDTPFAIIADPDDPRSIFFRNAMRAAGCQTPLVLSYFTCIFQPSIIGSLIPQGSVLRIESPGRSIDIHKAILNRGIVPAQTQAAFETPHEEIERLSQYKGLIINSRQWYLGFCSVLDSIDSAGRQTNARFTSDPGDIRILFDKSACQTRLQQAGLPVPHWLGQPENYDDLRQMMQAERCNRVFVKLRHGSAASGVVALETSRGRFQAWTTVETESIEGSLQLFNTRRIVRMQDEMQIATLIGTLAKHGLHAERWVPKAGYNNHRFDLRILVIGGNPAHAVVRMGKSPMTNLHLGNTRTSVGAVRHKITDDNWDRLMETCRRAGRLFHRSLHIALDVAISPCGRRHWILEANAFGDLLKDCRHMGMDPYELQIETLFGKRKKVHDVQRCAV